MTGAVDKYLVNFGKKGQVPSAHEIRQFVGELQNLDLYLALACARGNEQAWWEFDRKYRPFIERLARHVVGGSVDADEVIDFVYAELFGTRIAGGARQSRFKTYTGRGTLRGWLRAVICHAVVDLYRRQHAEVSLETCSKVGDEAHEMRAPSAGVRGAEDLMLESVVRERYRSVTVAALDRSLADLDDHETLLLLYYHLDGLKLREIARIVEDPASPIRRWFKRQSRGESKIKSSRIHESTVMRWLEKAYQKVLNSFHAALEHKHGLSAAEIELCIAIATEDLGHQVSLRHSQGLNKDEIKKGKAKRVS